MKTSTLIIVLCTLALASIAACTTPGVPGGNDTDGTTANGTFDVTISAEYPGRIIYTTSMDVNFTRYRAHCEALGGTLNECGNPCPPDAELCTAVCALTCDLPTFASRVRDLAINNSGGLIPIEGYDADLLMGALPALEPGDFDDVETFEGIYRFRNGVVVFERTMEQPISTAERTISEEGYETLLEHLKRRFSVTSEDDVLDHLAEE